MHPRTAVCSSALLCLALAAPAFAHHSFAMFDRGKTNSLTGTVKEFDMINPHGWLQLMVADPTGKVSEWSLETGAPGQLSRQGFQQSSLQPGDKVTATIHPLRDGSNGGQLVQVVLANGKTLGGGGPGFGGRF